MNTKKEDSTFFVRRLFGFSFGPVVNALIGFVSVPVTTWFLDPQELGRASMFTTAQGVFTVVIFLGLTNSFVREYKSGVNRTNLLYHCLVPPLIISVLLSIVTIFFNQKISYILFGQYDLFGTVMLAIVLPILVIEKYATNVVRMEEKARFYSLNMILRKISSFLILLSFLLLIESSYHAVLVASVGSTLIVTVLQIASMFHVWNDFSNFSFNKKFFSKLLKFGLPLIPAAGLSWIFNSIDMIALRTYSSFAELGIYTGAFKVISLFRIVKTSFNNFWIPTAYRWYENNERIGKFQKVSDTIMSLFAVLAVTVIVSRKIIFLLLSEKYLPSAQVFPFLIFIPVVMTVSETTVLGIAFSRKTYFHIIISLVVCIVNVTGNLLLVPIYGAVGAALSTGFSYIVFFFIRSYLSNRLWGNLYMGRHIINIILIAALTVITLFENEYMVYLEIVLSGIIILYNYKNAAHALRIGLKAVRSKG